MLSGGIIAGWRAVLCDLLHKAALGASNRDECHPHTPDTSCDHRRAPDRLARAPPPSSGMMRMPTVPGVFFQSATTSATAGSPGSTGLTMANRPEWPVVRVARSTIRQSTSAVAITSRLLGLHHRYARICPLVRSDGTEQDRKAPPRVRKPLPRNDQCLAPTPDLESHRKTPPGGVRRHHVG
jgi:hypothetical protein